MYSRASALTRAKQHRTCPPQHVAENPTYREHLRQHLAICPYCSTGTREELVAWERLGHAIQESMPSLISSESDEISPGQIRPIRLEIGKWHDGYFYNPPTVLVLAIRKGNRGEVRVAQLYHDICLAAPGDLILPDDEADEMFAECWNAYVLDAEDLGESERQVSREFTDAARKLAKSEDEEAHPPWALRPKPLADNDPRMYFRELEAEVGNVFGR